MNTFKKVLVDGFVGSAIVAAVASALALAIALGGKAAHAVTGGIVLDYNEQTHLEFMREEEKLARDVYIKLSTLYPDHPIFGTIDDSEQRHTDAVKAIIEKYGLEDPSTNDNVGVYTGVDYGWYFTEKFNLLVERA
jgi:hypothetical protein